MHSTKAEELLSSAATLEKLADYVKKNSGARLPLPGGRDLRVCGFSGTLYHAGTEGWEEDILQSWQNDYLPRPKKMVVLGTLEAIGRRPLGTGVILVGEHGAVYTLKDYDELHGLAPNLEDFLDMGLKRLDQKVYLYPDN